MSLPITPEKRTEILAAMKDQGLTLTAAAAKFAVAQSTIRKWIRRRVEGASGTSSEVQRLRREIQFLKETVADLYLEHRLAEKNERVH